MDVIFHEKQQGSLCAQHCLNALLQGPYFTAVDLAAIGRQMDGEERAAMAEAGLSSEEYAAFLREPSSNVDDSGYFSIQVLSAALSVWGLELVPFNSSDPRATAARLKPTDASAFVCHYRDHWLAIRKLGHQWFNLNSLLSGPQLLSDTYLSLFLAQLQTDRYSIFVVLGQLPESEADRILTECPLSPSHFRKAQQVTVRPSDAADDELSEEQDDQLKEVLEMSRKELEEEEDREALNKAILQSLQSSGFSLPTNAPVDEPKSTTRLSDSEEDLRRAISLSLQAEETPPLPSSSSNSAAESLDFIRQQRLLRLGHLSSSSSTTNP